MPISPLVCIDFYKTDHRRQYPEGTSLVVSNFTPRSGKHANVPNKDEICFFGLQYFIKDFLIRIWNDGFFKLERSKAVSDYKRRLDNSLGIDAVPVDHIEALHDLQYLPIEIKSLPEGSIVPMGVPVLTIHNTRPEFFWLTNYLETILSAYLWLPSTSATTAMNYRRLINQVAAKTGSPEWFADFQAHDFSFRGMSSLQSALLSGAAHLLFFKGTDTVAAIDFLENFYGADCTKELIGTSVPATEHSVMCMGGESEDQEVATFDRLITNYTQRGLFLS
jgi:nicotinamide phosphoribosyltransferase